ncbi:TspO/MBR-related protein [Annulohypoxylon maeteangense]|uniref:TspO/MBR-related protein n=1 Tax=Annulohypoxylon maeteangense TaxID=1927788 RepID=UPI002008AC2D|nr:TspO/MBR-related protein [Annulohypoxylon maeteangense]KAI0890428.1 TspO/MBR-related protein [Annulohypoxylon maeteangense]
MTTSIPSLISIPYNVFASPAASILLPIALGTTTGLGSGVKQSQTAYHAMKQPPLSPPAQVFGPAWTLLYGLMGYASHRAITMSPPSSASTDKMGALYTIQLGVNILWMPLFFGMRRVDLAAADIVLLAGLNGYLTYLYFSVDNLAGWCQVPHLAWLAFATYLTGGVGYLNNWDISKAKLGKRV